MSATQVKLYQRLSIPGYPIVKVLYSRNGIPLKDSRTTGYYLRYRQDGKRHCDPAGGELIEAENKRKALELQLSVGVNACLILTCPIPSATATLCNVWRRL